MNAQQRKALHNRKALLTELLGLVEIFAVFTERVFAANPESEQQDAIRHLLTLHERIDRVLLA